MPELPAFLAKRAERWFGLASTVTAAEQLAPLLRRVRFAGDALRARPWVPGHEIEFRVGEGHLRHYTPAAYDTNAGELEVLFHLHGNGPGSRWAAQLAPGQAAWVLGPGGNFTLSAQSAWHLFLGDASALGALHALTTALPIEATVLGAVELAPGNETAARAWVPRLAVLSQQPTHGAALDSWLAECTLPAGEGTVYLIGHTQSIQRQRHQLLAHHGLKKSQIKTKPYWADGKRGL